jgi:hypothetical protein
MLLGKIVGGCVGGSRESSEVQKIILNAQKKKWKYFFSHVKVLLIYFSIQILFIYFPHTISAKKDFIFFYGGDFLKKHYRRFQVHFYLHRLNVY